jgi:hypothetical protein
MIKGANKVWLWVNDAEIEVRKILFHPKLEEDLWDLRDELKFGCILSTSNLI